MRNVAVVALDLDRAVRACRARPCRSGPSAGAASRAASSASRPRVDLPSESSRIAAGGGFCPGRRRRADRVQRRGDRVAGRGAAAGLQRADRARRRVVVGGRRLHEPGVVVELDEAGAHAVAAAARPSRPPRRARRSGGRARRPWPASSPRRRSASMTVACSTGTATVVCGRASPTSSAVERDRRRRAIGAWRRQPGRRGATAGMSAGLANARRLRAPAPQVPGVEPQRRRHEQQAERGTAVRRSDMARYRSGGCRGRRRPSSVAPLAAAADLDADLVARASCALIAPATSSGSVTRSPSTPT